MSSFLEFHYPCRSSIPSEQGIDLESLKLNQEIERGSIHVEVNDSLGRRPEEQTVAFEGVKKAFFK
jgi:hypothetical protein